MKKLTILFSFLLIFTLFFTVSTYAAETNLPDFSHLLTNSNDIFITYDSGSEICLLVINSDTPMTGLKFYIKDGDSSGFYVKNDYSFNVNFTVYEVRSNSSWGLDYSSYIPANNQNMFFRATNLSFFSSNVSIYNGISSDDPFFPLPPTPSNPTVEEMIAEETPKMAEKVIQTMKIILLCGVGCLALLISLPVLAKVFYRFH